MGGLNPFRARKSHLRPPRNPAEFIGRVFVRRANTRRGCRLES